MSGIISNFANGTLVLTISNESKRNAFTHAMTADLGNLLKTAEEDTEVKCVVITGAGNFSFSSGHDLDEMLANRDSASDPALNYSFLLPAEMTTPTIAAINGYAIAAGFVLAISCDMRVCAENAAFSAPGARIGLLPIGGQISRLPMLMPRAIAHELLVTCREMKAEEALRVGFVNRLVPKGEAVAASLEIAEMIKYKAMSVVSEVKNGLKVLDYQGERAAAEFEWEIGKALQSGSDAEEGIRAFREKREPRFR